MPQLTAQERFDAKVERTDTCWIWIGARLPRGYGQFHYQGQRQLAHRVAWQMYRGPIPDGMVIDHECHTPECVNPEHLRLATIRANVENTGGARACNKTSAVRGVYWHKKIKRWQATVGHRGRKVYVGVFDDLSEAEAAVKAKRAELFTFPEYEPQTA